MKIFYAALCFCFAAMFAGGCVSGLKRTDKTELKGKDFPTIGISMELPVMLCDSTEYKGQH